MTLRVFKAPDGHTQPTYEMTPVLLDTSLSQSQKSSRKLTRPSFLSVNGRRAQLCQDVSTVCNQRDDTRQLGKRNA